MVWIGQNLILKDHDDSVVALIYSVFHWIDPTQL